MGPHDLGRVAVERGGPARALASAVTGTIRLTISPASAASPKRGGLQVSLHHRGRHRRRNAGLVVAEFVLSVDCAVRESLVFRGGIDAWCIFVVRATRERLLILAGSIWMQGELRFAVLGRCAAGGMRRSWIWGSPTIHANRTRYTPSARQDGDPPRTTVTVAPAKQGLCRDKTRS
jgi:hypothetical protein